MEIDNIGLQDCSLNFFDIGAAGDINPRWKDLRQAINYFGAEPNANEIPQKSHSYRSQKIIDCGIWNWTGTKNLNVCKSPPLSSMLMPNFKLINQFPDPERFNVVKKNSVNVLEYNEALEEMGCQNEIDFIDIDIQGAELKILKCSNHENLMGINIEVLFEEIYVGSNLFWEVDHYLRNLGFSLWDMKRLHWQRAGITNDIPIKGQLMCGDALYLRKVQYIENMNNIHVNEKAVKYLMILAAYKLHDYLAFCTERFAASKIITHEQKIKIFDYIMSEVRERYQLADHTKQSTFRFTKGRLIEREMGNNK